MNAGTLQLVILFLTNINSQIHQFMGHAKGPSSNPFEKTYVNPSKAKYNYLKIFYDNKYGYFIIKQCVS